MLLTYPSPHRGGWHLASALLPLLPLPSPLQFDESPPVSQVSVRDDPSGLKFVLT